MPDWIIVAAQIAKILAFNIDDVEASAIAFYLEQTEDSLLVIDERKRRMIAKDLGIKIKPKANRNIRKYSTKTNYFILCKITKN